MNDIRKEGRKSPASSSSAFLTRAGRARPSNCRANTAAGALS